MKNLFVSARMVIILFLCAMSNAEAQQTKTTPTLQKAKTDTLYNLSGVWLKDDKDSIELKRTKIIDSDGSIGYTGMLPGNDGKKHMWLAYLQNKDVIMCIPHGSPETPSDLKQSDAGRCGSFMCSGSFTVDGEIVGTCTFALEPNKQYPFKMTRVKK